MKKLASDERALVPLLVGIAAVGGLLFGGSYLLTGEDPITAFVELMKAITVGCLLFIFGLLLLMNKFGLIHPSIALVAGVCCVAGGLYVIWKGVPF